MAAAMLTIQTTDKKNITHNTVHNNGQYGSQKNVSAFKSY